MWSTRSRMAEEEKGIASHQDSYVAKWNDKRERGRRGRGISFGGKRMMMMVLERGDSFLLEGRREGGRNSK